MPRKLSPRTIAARRAIESGQPYIASGPDEARAAMAALRRLGFTGLTVQGCTVRRTSGARRPPAPRAAQLRAAAAAAPCRLDFSSPDEAFRARQAAYQAGLAKRCSLRLKGSSLHFTPRKDAEAPARTDLAPLAEAARRILQDYAGPQVVPGYSLADWAALSLCGKELLTATPTPGGLRIADAAGA